MLSEERQRELDHLLDGDLSDEGRAEVQASLESDPEAIDWLADRALLHANLRRTMQRRALETRTQTQPQRAQKRPISTRSLSQSWMAIAAVLVAVLTLVFLLRPSSDQTFATLEQTRAALWESGELPTADGSRLGRGTLRLVEGLATLRFDSGAEVILEAPASLTLVDSMNCELSKGTAVSDMPESAFGFRIKTPCADVVDYGTRFAVSVHEGTGETHTQVMEGRVQVEYAASDRVVELKTGQRNTVAGETISEATVETEQEPRTIPVSQLDFGPNWTLLETSKDAYTGFIKGHESDIQLYVKNAVDISRANRVSYLGFDLNGVDSNRIEEAELLLYFAPTGWGLASHVPDASFSVYGLIGDVPEWDESILHGEFPGNPDVTHLGSFQIDQGVQKGRFRVHSESIAAFLREYAGSEITLRVVRDTQETNGGGLVHGFASRRHPILPAPTLAIRLTAP
ncbi:MAG: FecR domain-containing protein [Verrucomicrobiota bacterium]